MTLLPVSITKALDDYIESVEEPREPDGKYHPSQFWGCDRQTMYALRGVERSNPPDARSKRRFKIGHVLHELVQEALSQSPDIIAFYPEFAIGDPDLNTGGHGDGLIFFSDGTVVVVELKSIRKNGFRYLAGKPKADHKKQAGTYAVHARLFGCWVDTGERNPDGTPKMEFIPPLGERLIGVLFGYFEKEDLDTAEFFEPYDSEWEDELRDKVESLQPYRGDPESLPPRLPLVKGKKPWNCDYCDWKDRCWKQDVARRDPVTEADLVTVEHW